MKSSESPVLHCEVSPRSKFSILFSPSVLPSSQLMKLVPLSLLSNNPSFPGVKSTYPNEKKKTHCCRLPSKSNGFSHTHTHAFTTKHVFQLKRALKRGNKRREWQDATKPTKPCKCCFRNSFVKPPKRPKNVSMCPPEGCLTLFDMRMCIFFQVKKDLEMPCTFKLESNH